MIIKDLQCHTLHLKFKYLCVGDASLLRDDKKSSVRRGVRPVPAQRRHSCRPAVEYPSMIQKHKKRINN